MINTKVEEINFVKFYYFFFHFFLCFVKNNFFYIGALGSKKTHEARCQRLKDAGYTKKQINSIHGPIGLKLGGKSAPEIALSIVAQLVSETNKYKKL